MTIKNKLGIENSAQLTEAEERITKQKALELFETGALDRIEVGAFKGLAEIHRRLFDEIYDFAGKMRTENIAKGTFRFAPVMYLSANLEQIDKMPQSSFEEIVEKYVEMNVAHPFREGNGRSTRLWLDAILRKELGLMIDWSKVDKTDYLRAMERSPVWDLEIKSILRDALTDRVADREAYMKSIDASYAYEGYELYKTADIGKKIEDKCAGVER